MIHGDELDCKASGNLLNLIVTGLLPEGRTLKRDTVRISFAASRRGDRMDLPEMVIEDAALSGRFKGIVTDLAKTPQTTLDGTFSVSLDRTADLLRGLLPSDLRTLGAAKGSLQLAPRGETLGFTLNLDATSALVGYGQVLTKTSGQRCLVAATGSSGRRR